MKKEDFILAINILTMHHSNEIIINKVGDGEGVTRVLENPTIHIKSCVSSVVNTLIKNGFKVGMCNGLMTVNKY